MDSSVSVTNSHLIRHTPATLPLPSPQRVMTPSRLAKLPPIASTPDHQADDSSTQYRHAANLELKECMHHLLAEAQSAETRMQAAIDTLWQKMLEMLEARSIEFKGQLTKEQEELSLARVQLERLMEREAALAHQNAKMSVDLVTADKQHQSLQAELASAKKELSLRESELNSTHEEMKSKLEKSNIEVDALRKTSVDQSKIIKEYQDKVSRMTEKLQKLSRDLTAEKESSQQLQKSTSNQINQRTSENRIMALEISKLKAQLASSGSALSTSREEVKKLESQLKNVTASSETTVSSLHTQHIAVVKSLQEKISVLEEELARQQAGHERDIKLLEEKLQKAMHTNSGDDDHILARIKFLQHQNKQEKVKLQQEKA